MNRALRLMLMLAAVALAVPLLLFAAWFLGGSLEAFPTAEQQDKARLAAGTGLVVLALVEVWIVARLLRR